MERIISRIKKRDGSVVDFTQDKITHAVYKAMESHGLTEQNEAKSISDLVTFMIEERFGGYTVPSVEQIQDIVELILMRRGHHDIAKSYILYREKHKEIRQARETGINLGEVKLVNLGNAKTIEIAKYMTTIVGGKGDLAEIEDKIDALKEYISSKQDELTKYNNEHQVDGSIIVNGRRMTNIGTFRAYLKAYLNNHPKIHNNMTFMVRQLPSGETGLPIEIYVFSNDQDWVRYEGIQSDIFDHILAVLPSFDLRVYQYPAGVDLAGHFRS